MVRLVRPQPTGPCLTQAVVLNDFVNVDPLACHLAVPPVHDAYQPRRVQIACPATYRADQADVSTRNEYCDLVSCCLTEEREPVEKLLASLSELW